MISLTNATALATVMEVAGFASTHFVNLSAAMKMCESTFIFLERTYQI
jgi:hypothetical protein